jgi:hypothetical protein
MELNSVPAFVCVVVVIVDYDNSTLKSNDLK